MSDQRGESPVNLSVSTEDVDGHRVVSVRGEVDVYSAPTLRKCLQDSMDDQHRDLIVHEDLAPDVIAIFGQLHLLGYPIAKIQTVDHYADADDELSMEDNNTSAFNCRRIPETNEWSPHAYGRAIDINTLINPCLYASGYFEPQNAAAYLDRSRTDPGLLHNGDPAELVFADRGWQWGGDWRAPDYQHFERP